jgi:hypothetical protein
VGQLDITEADLKALPQGVAREAVKAILNVRQALFDTLGGFPADNVMPYFYSFINTTANANAIPANGTIQNSIKISADAAFVGMSIRGASDGDYTAFMRIDASDRQLMNIQIHSSALMGTAERPGPLHKPLLLPANTTISFDVTDLSGATNQLYFVIAGFKVYGRRVAG